MGRLAYLANRILRKFGLNNNKPLSINDWEYIIKANIKEQLAVIRPFIGRDHLVLVDIGANVGAFTEGIMNVNKNITAYLFEPVPRYFEHMRQKFAGKQNIQLENLALSDNAGTFKLWVHQQNLGWNTMIQEKVTSNMEEITINAQTFDAYASQMQLNRIDIIKIDVEGAEFKVLAGMKNTLSGMPRKPVIICEVAWGKTGNPNWQELTEIFEWLFEHGYKRFDYNQITKTVDILLVPESVIENCNRQ